jgi:UDP-N-acetylglucosamine--N-acetylmuramyl-(pentapeptide) pyrophosphoryl-undecaprenol N-acetylglucosamine transferase
MNIVIAAGGTGGHLYPAIALAQEFVRQDLTTSVLFIGTTRGIEGKVLPREGLSLRTITALPVMGGGPMRVLSGLWALRSGIGQSISILRAHKAVLVIGIGGYTSPPVLAAAGLLRIPCALLEPNACPGMANRALGPLARRIFLAFASAAPYFSRSKVRVVGTPIRRSFFERDGSDSVPVDPPSDRRKTLLIFGGSQGARAINDAVIDALPRLQAMKEWMAIIHQTGEADHARVRMAYEAAGLEARVTPFLFDMPMVLRAADLVVSRAGAVTVAELTACGKPSILIPLPQAIYQHQLRNAEVLRDAGAAVLIPQAELMGNRLAETIERVLHDENRLRDMGAKSRALGRTDAAERIVQECRTLLGCVA